MRSSKQVDAGRGKRGRTPDPAARLAIVGLLLWMIMAALFALTVIGDPDLGRHIAYGRLLIKDFSGVARITFGQDPSILHQAYSYWLYDAGVAILWDHVGPAAIVLLRAVLLIASLCGAIAIARKRGGGPAAIAACAAVAVAISQERFLDRPELFSFVFWIAALRILIEHREDRGRWLLVPLQILWVNTHLWFGLLPALAVAFLAGDALDQLTRGRGEGGRGRLRRGALLSGAVLVATLINPEGPGAWRSQLYLVQFLGRNYSLPFTIQEMRSPYSSYEPSPAVWIFRFAMPAGMLIALGARRRIGWGALFALAISAVLSAKARRAMPLFALTSLAVVPAAVSELGARIPSRAREIGATAVAAILVAIGAAGVYGLVSGRIFIATDQDTQIGLAMSPRYPALDAARFLARESCPAPIFSNAVAAGSIVLENGLRLPPFLDARWIGTPETIQAYQDLRSATDETIPAVWRRIDGARRFETVALDFYEMPALLRFLTNDNPGWATVYLDGTCAVLLRRDKLNESRIRRLEPKILLASAGRDPKRDQELSGAIIRFLNDRKPSILTPLRFPYDPFYRANYALQVRRVEDAKAAYIDLLNQENGSLKASRHRIEILNNLFWCLLQTREADGIDALAEALGKEPGTDAKRRRAIQEQQARALEALGATEKAQAIAQRILADDAATADDRWTAWCRIASIRTKAGDWQAAADALVNASKERPRAPEVYRSLGAILEFKLSKPAEALRAYETFRSLGGQDPDVDSRIRVLQSEPSASR